MLRVVPVFMVLIAGPVSETPDCQEVVVPLVTLLPVLAHPLILIGYLHLVR